MGHFVTIDGLRTRSLLLESEVTNLLTESEGLDVEGVVWSHGRWLDVDRVSDGRGARVFRLYGGNPEYEPAPYLREQSLVADGGAYTMSVQLRAITDGAVARLDFQTTGGDYEAVGKDWQT